MGDVIEFGRKPEPQQESLRQIFAVYCTNCKTLIKYPTKPEKCLRCGKQTTVVVDVYHESAKRI